MFDKENNDRFDSKEELIAHLEWENLQLKAALEERTRERNLAYGDSIRYAAALREVPKFLQMYVERP